MKGANAVNLTTMQAAVLIGDRAAGTINPTLQCAVGRRVELFLPVGLEKRITGRYRRNSKKAEFYFSRRSKIYAGIRNTGNAEQLNGMDELFKSVHNEPNFEL